MSYIENCKKKWFDINQPIGKKLGYPDCCIKEFCDQPPELLKITGATKKDRRRYRAGHIEGHYTGFIPCYYHAEQIRKGRITLNSLIKDRDGTLPPFPFV